MGAPLRACQKNCVGRGFFEPMGEPTRRATRTWAGTCLESIGNENAALDLEWGLDRQGFLCGTRCGGAWRKQRPMAINDDAFATVVRAASVGQRPLGTASRATCAGALAMI